MRHFILAFTLITFICTADDLAKRPLTELLADEDSGKLDNLAVPESEQIDAAVKRLHRYVKEVAETNAEIDACKACLKRCIARIVERARQKVREAEERLERVKEKSVPKESA